MPDLPALLCVDDDADVLDAVRELDRRGQTIALLLSDQRMPQMDGVRFLAQAAEVFPRAKRVLLTAYADTDAATASINESRADHYLL